MRGASKVSGYSPKAPGTLYPPPSSTSPTLNHDDTPSPSPNPAPRPSRPPAPPKPHTPCLQASLQGLRPPQRRQARSARGPRAQRRAPTRRQRGAPKAGDPGGAHSGWPLEGAAAPRILPSSLVHCPPAGRSGSGSPTAQPGPAARLPSPGRFRTVPPTAQLPHTNPRQPLPFPPPPRLRPFCHSGVGGEGCPLGRSLASLSAALPASELQRPWSPRHDAWRLHCFRLRPKRGPGGVEG